MVVLLEEPTGDNGENRESKIRFLRHSFFVSSVASCSGISFMQKKNPGTEVPGPISANEFISCG
jgi:hypothetical protein